MPRRLKFTMEFEADLDMVPGWGHQPIDWINLARDGFVNRSSPYGTKGVLVGDIVEVDGVKTANLGRGGFRDFYDPKEQPEAAA